MVCRCAAAHGGRHTRPRAQEMRPRHLPLDLRASLRQRYDGMASCMASCMASSVTSAKFAFGGKDRGGWGGLAL